MTSPIKLTLKIKPKSAAVAPVATVALVINKQSITEFLLTRKEQGATLVQIAQHFNTKVPLLKKYYTAEHVNYEPDWCGILRIDCKEAAAEEAKQKRINPLRKFKRREFYTWTWKPTGPHRSIVLIHNSFC